MDPDGDEDDHPCFIFMMFDVLHLDHAMADSRDIERMRLIIEHWGYALRPPQRAM